MSVYSCFEGESEFKKHASKKLICTLSKSTTTINHRTSIKGDSGCCYWWQRWWEEATENLTFSFYWDIISFHFATVEQCHILCWYTVTSLFFWWVYVLHFFYAPLPSSFSFLWSFTIQKRIFWCNAFSWVSERLVMVLSVLAAQRSEINSVFSESTNKASRNTAAKMQCLSLSLFHATIETIGESFLSLLLCWLTRVYSFVQYRTFGFWWCYPCSIPLWDFYWCCCLDYDGVELHPFSMLPTLMDS